MDRIIIGNPNVAEEPLLVLCPIPTSGKHGEPQDALTPDGGYEMWRERHQRGLARVCFRCWFLSMEGWDRVITFDPTTLEATDHTGDATVRFCCSRCVLLLDFEHVHLTKTGAAKRQEQAHGPHSHHP